MGFVSSCQCCTAIWLDWSACCTSLLCKFGVHNSPDPSLTLTLRMWLRETNVHMYTLEGNILSRCFVITWCSCSGQSCCGTASYCVKLAAIFGRARVMPFPVSPSAGYLHTNLQPEQGQSSRGNPPLQVSAEADEKNFNDRPVALLCTNIIHRKEYHELV